LTTDTPYRANQVTVAHVSSVHRWDDVRIFKKEAVALAAAGFDTFVVAAEDVPQAREFKHSGVRVCVLPRRRGRFARMILTAPAVLRRATKTGASVLHIHDIELVPWALVARSLGYGVVLDLHENYPALMRSKSWLPRCLRSACAFMSDWLIRLAARVFSGVVCADDEIGARIQRSAPGQELIVVHNYPDLRLFHEAHGCGNVARYASARIAFLGGISDARAARQFVQALTILDDLAFQVTLGGGVASHETLSAVRQEPGWRRVTDLGRIPPQEVPAVLKQSAISIVLFSDSPNHHDLRSNRLYESLAAGCPVLVSDFPAWSRFTQQHSCGLVANPSDAQSIAAALRNALMDPPKLQALGLNGKRVVEQHFSWRSQAEILVRFYSRVFLGADTNADSQMAKPQ
jgi:glycosyltransferase involved in cell wall biosynthesis